MLQPNALGVKLRLAATEPRPRPPPPTARCQLQLLVGQTAYRCGLTRCFHPHAMEFTPGSPHVIRPVAGPAGPPREGVMGVPGAATASGHCPPAVVPRPLAATRHTTPLAGLPSCSALMRRAPPMAAGRSTPPRDDARAHEQLPAGRTPLGMGVPPLGTHRLPVQTHRARPPAVARAPCGRRARASACVGWYSP